MREFEFTKIDSKVLGAGLRNTESMLVNDLSLLELYNLECSDGGLILFVFNNIEVSNNLSILL